MPQRFAFVPALVLALTLAYRAADAQSIPTDSIVRVHVITLDSTWYVAGKLVSITGDSVVIRAEQDSSRVAFDRIHVLSVERRTRAAGVGHSALVGCGIVGGGLGLLGVIGTVFGDKSGGDGDEQAIAAVLTVVVTVGGCALGAAVGALAATAHHYNWRTIDMPPRTGTEGDTSDVSVRGPETRSRAASRGESAGEFFFCAGRYRIA